jgi:poly(3-hydroxybutyrate) depolymerase
MQCNGFLNMRLLGLGAVLSALLLTGWVRAADELPALQAQAARTSVSGLSSGGFMAVQYGTAYSASVMGVGVVAGGPYNCAYANLGGIFTCIAGAPLGLMSWTAAQTFALQGQIDPAAGIARQRVYVFSGTKDDVVAPDVMRATRDFYRAAGVRQTALAYVSQVPAGHAFVSPTFGNPCSANAPPYIDRCAIQGLAYDQPRAILQKIYGTLRPAAVALSATVRPFDQRAFASADSGLDTVGFYYLPASCRAHSDQCAVHVVLHGCKQGASVVGSDVYGKVGFNQWADSNHLIVLYPQVVATDIVPFNPQGCWDWWGYSGPNFALKAGPQMRAIKAMVDRLTLAE